MKANAQACSTCPGTIYTAINSSVLGSTLTNQKFCITTSLTLNQDLVLDGCTVFMSPGAVIEIPSGFKLTITNKTYISSCGSTGNMWQGIHVASGGNSTPLAHLIVDKGSVIEDAINAVYTDLSEGKGEINLSDSYFNRNYRDVYIHKTTPPSTTGRYSLTGTINNCHFICKTAWNSLTDDVLHQPQGGRTHVNIEFDCVELSAPTHLYPVTISDNFFDNSDQAILAFYSATIVQGNSFKNIGLGIEAYFDGTITAQNNYTFTNVSHCIYVHDIVNNVNIVDNKIQGNSYRGITVKNGCIATPIIINHNEINNCSNYAIRVYNNPSAQGKSYVININDNIITNSQYTYAMGILVHEKPPFKPTPVPPNVFSFEVNRNVMNGQYIGIEVRNGYNTEIKDNLIGITDVGASKGINIGNTFKPFITNNSITGVSLNANCEPNLNKSTGINLTNSPDAVTMCNTVDQLNIGVAYNYFTGNIISTAFYENVLGFCKYQFYLNKAPNGLGNIGSQSIPSNNSWTSPNCTSGVYLNTRADASNLQSNGVFTNFFTNAALPIYNDGINNGVPCIFLTTNAVTIDGCGRTPPDDLVALIDKINSENSYDANYRYWQNDYLMQRAREDGTLADSIIALQDLIDSLEQTNHGYFATINDTTQNYNLDSMTNATLVVVQALNNSVQPDLVLETNYKILNQIYFSALVNGINALNTSFISTLTNIAAQCPLSGGKAVYLARFLLEAATDVVVEYNDDCDIYQPVMRYKNKIESTNTAHVYVAENKINLRFDTATLTAATFSLYNTLGTCIAQYTISKNADAALFDLPNINGFYIYKITGLAGGELNGKLLAVKK